MPEPLRLRLFENYRFVLYAPFYAAHATGAYEAEGLEVELLPSPGPGKAEAALAAGEIDVLWMGPIRVMKHHDENPDSPLVEFAEVVCRDPFSLVGARAQPGFPPRRTGRIAFRQHQRGADPVAVPRTGSARRRHRPGPARPRITGSSMADNVAALRDGSLDVAQLFEPYVEQAVSGGAAIWYPASARGRPATRCSSRRATGWPPIPSRSAAWRGRCAARSNGSRPSRRGRWPPRSPIISPTSTAAC